MANRVLRFVQEGRVGWIRRLRNTLTGGARDSFEEESRFHLERRVEKLRRLRA